MPPVGFEHTISAGERLKTYALNRAANGTGSTNMYRIIIAISHNFLFQAVDREQYIYTRRMLKCIYVFLESFF
jgi:hypothetical protein